MTSSLLSFVSAHVISVHLLFVSFPSCLLCPLFPFLWVSGSSSSMARTRPQDFMGRRDMEELENTTAAASASSPYWKRGEEEKRRGKYQKRTQNHNEVVKMKCNEEDSFLQDPLEVLGWDIMMKILSNLDARSVARSLLVSRGWLRLACSDRLWSSKCEELWVGKAHIPRLSQVRGISKLAAYSLSVMDGKRNRIMRDDLCDHVWEFHFTKVAPEYWRNLDPYWKGTGPLMRRYFHQDGSQTADPGDRVWGGHECCFSVVTSFVGDGTIREHYVRINRWPRMLVSRKQDWSWEMSNHLFCYSSIPDAYKEGGTGPLFLVM